MREFKDLSNYSLEEKQELFFNTYGKKFHITGKKSPVVDRIVSLNNNTKPNPERLAVIEGIWALDLALKYNIAIKYLVVCLEKIRSIESQKLIDHFVNLAEESHIVSERVFDSISEKDNAQGIIAVCYMPVRSLEDVYTTNNSVVIVLDGLEIPGNVGTIMRSADATAVDSIFITNKKTRMNHPKLIRSSMGAAFKLPVVESSFEEISKWLIKNNYRIILADTAAEAAYYEFDYKGRIAIVMGSEKYGISEKWYELQYTGVSIPMLGDCDSLNVGVAATILLYEASLKNKGYIKRK